MARKTGFYYWTSTANSNYPNEACMITGDTSPYPYSPGSILENFNKSSELGADHILVGFYYWTSTEYNSLISYGTYENGKFGIGWGNDDKTHLHGA